LKVFEDVVSKFLPWIWMIHARNKQDSVTKIYSKLFETLTPFDIERNNKTK